MKPQTCRTVRPHSRLGTLLLRRIGQRREHREGLYSPCLCWLASLLPQVALTATRLSPRRGRLGVGGQHCAQRLFLSLKTSGNSHAKAPGANSWWLIAWLRRAHPTEPFWGMWCNRTRSDLVFIHILQLPSDNYPFFPSPNKILRQTSSQNFCELQGGCYCILVISCPYFLVLNPWSASVLSLPCYCLSHKWFYWGSWSGIVPYHVRGKGLSHYLTRQHYK